MTLTDNLRTASAELLCTDNGCLSAFEIGEGHATADCTVEKSEFSFTAHCLPARRRTYLPPSLASR